MTDRRAGVVALAAHARNVPVAEREALRGALEALDLPLVVVHTCHRVDAFATPGGDEAAAVLAALDAVRPVGAGIATGEAAIRHAVRVAAGRDSVVLGEDQVLHQVRVAVDEARASGRLTPALERLFSAALRAGRRSRSWRPDRARSLADAALDAVASGSGEPLEGRDVLVVGAGSMGTLAAHAARRGGAQVVVANRTHATAVALARTVGGRASSLDPGADAPAPAVVVLAIGGPWVIASATRRHLVESGTWIVDLSVPRAVDPELAASLGDRLIDADGLAAGTPLGSGGVQDDAADAAWTRRVDALVESTTREVLAWLAGSPARDAANALQARADRERQAELELLFRRRPGLDPADRDAIERMTRHLADRLLQAPLERLGRDPDGEDGRAVRDLFAL
jgi:glutamyl-tRNA reductase